MDKNIYFKILVSVRTNKYIKDFLQSTILPSSLINVVFKVPDVSYFINESQGNVFDKRSRTRLFNHDKRGKGSSTSLV